MKIIQLTGDIPPCCCGESSSGGICFGSQAKCKLTISAPGCSADARTAETIAGPVDHWSWQVWMSPGDCEGEYGGSNAWDFVMDCIDGVYVMRMYQERENGVVECRYGEFGPVQSAAGDVHTELRSVLRRSGSQCDGGGSGFGSGVKRLAAATSRRWICARGRWRCM
jgi:hypothetical protein